MAETPNLALDLIEAAQTQKHVPVNEALSKLDALTHLAVGSRSLTAPPADPAEGAGWIVAAPATGDWTAQEGRIAVFLNGGWWFAPARAGMRVWIADEALLMLHDGAAWLQVAPAPQSSDRFGVNATADATNRLAVKADAVLLSHDDVTPGSGDIRLTLNKSGAADTASLVLQSAYSGRAEVGLSGDEDLSVKVSADGTSFTEALRIDRATGTPHFPQGATGLAPAAFGDTLITTDYAIARGVDLMTNGTGVLGTNYNLPGFTFDPLITPGLRGSFRHDGYFTQLKTASELVAVDPGRVYRLSVMVHQEDTPGDWSAFADGPRHAHFAGLIEYDADGNTIESKHHMRYHHAGTDSLTTLAAPLAPGDTSMSVVNAAGWNESATSASSRGVAIFGWRNALGYLYPHYTRHVATDLFALGGVDKGTHVITLTAAFPATMANPDDPSGVWPAGTPIANSTVGLGYKYSLMNADSVPAVDTWYRRTTRMGGVDTSGRNQTTAFSPGVSTVRLFVMPNYTNRAGGFVSWPDTGAAHAIRFAGFSIMPDLLAEAVAEADGQRTIHAVSLDAGAGTVTAVSGGAATNTGWVAV